jgi:hypothetical protein
MRKTETDSTKKTTAPAKAKARNVKEKLPPAGLDETTDRSTGADRTDQRKSSKQAPKE